MSHMAEDNTERSLSSLALTAYDTVIAGHTIVV